MARPSVSMQGKENTKYTDQEEFFGEERKAEQAELAEVQELRLEELRRIKSKDTNDPWSFENILPVPFVDGPIVSYLQLVAYIKGKDLRKVTCKQYKCCKCHGTYSTKGSLRCHKVRCSILRQEAKKLLYNYECSRCSSKFVTKYSFCYHRRTCLKTGCHICKNTRKKCNCSCDEVKLARLNRRNSALARKKIPVVSMTDVFENARMSLESNQVSITVSGISYIMSDWYGKTLVPKQRAYKCRRCKLICFDKISAIEHSTFHSTNEYWKNEFFINPETGSCSFRTSDNKNADFVKCLNCSDSIINNEDVMLQHLYKNHSFALPCGNYSHWFFDNEKEEVKKNEINVKAAEEKNKPKRKLLFGLTKLLKNRRATVRKTNTKKKTGQKWIITDFSKSPVKNVDTNESDGS